MSKFKRKMYYGAIITQDALPGRSMDFDRLVTFFQAYPPGAKIQPVLVEGEDVRAIVLPCDAAMLVGDLDQEYVGNRHAGAEFAAMQWALACCGIKAVPEVRLLIAEVR